jgi:hypothetical protein
VHPPEQQTDFETRLPVAGKYQIRIDLLTDERDPEIEGDDGTRTLYVKGWMQGSIGDALRKAGVKEPQKGAKLTVKYTGDGAPTRPGLRGPKQYEAHYEPSGGFFTGNGSAAPAQAQIPESPPPGIDPAAWAAMPAQAKQAIANVSAGMSDTPPF